METKAFGLYVYIYIETYIDVYSGPRYNSRALSYCQQTMDSQFVEAAIQGGSFIGWAIAKRPFELLSIS